jgi:hypothetical protein
VKAEDRPSIDATGQSTTTPPERTHSTTSTGAGPRAGNSNPEGLIGADCIDKGASRRPLEVIAERVPRTDKLRRERLDPKHVGREPIGITREESNAVTEDVDGGPFWSL